MTDTLPEPKSRKESYLAKAAGMDVTIPDHPESRLEQYLNAIAEGGGGGGGTTYTAGDGIDITDSTISATTKGLTKLTEADYDYPVGSEDGVALWLLPAGRYSLDGIKAYIADAAGYGIEYGNGCEYLSSGVNTGGVVVSNGLTLQSVDSNGSLSDLRYQNALPLSYGQIADTTGQSTELVMSQKAITDALSSAGGAVKTLTTADYNYPVSNPDSISFLLLEPGFYKVEDPAYVRILANSKVWYQGQSLFYVTDVDGNGNKYFWEFCTKNSLDTQHTYPINIYTGSPTSGAISTSITNHLVTEAFLKKNYKPIQQASAPTTSTAGTVGQMCIDTTNGEAYICVSALGTTYTWKQITNS